MYGPPAGDVVYVAASAPYGVKTPGVARDSPQDDVFDENGWFKVTLTLSKTTPKEGALAKPLENDVAMVVFDPKGHNPD